MSIQSLDPRITRLKIEDTTVEVPAKPALDQHETYEVFHQLKEGKAYEFVGIVHAPNEEMALLFAKEQYSRRGNFCSGIWVIKTTLVKMTGYSDGEVNAYDLFVKETAGSGGIEAYEVFHLKKRGKAHTHAGTVMAASHGHALSEAKKQFAGGGLVLNIWAVRQADLLKIGENDRDIWNTLPEKKYRDAIAWKAGDKIKAFKEEQLKKQA